MGKFPCSFVTTRIPVFSLLNKTITTVDLPLTFFKVLLRKSALIPELVKGKLSECA
jgi:hypothetical protein